MTARRCRGALSGSAVRFFKVRCLSGCLRGLSGLGKENMRFSTIREVQKLPTRTNLRREGLTHYKALR